jgi:probable HAF family extracellular repeat protein
MRVCSVVGNPGRGVIVKGTFCRMALGAALCMVVGLWLPGRATAATTVFKGSVVAGGAAVNLPLTATTGGQLSARLLWTLPDARAKLVLQRSAAAGGWVTVASSSGNKPVLLSYASMTTGRWRLRVVPVSGRAAFTLEVSYPGVVPAAPPFLTLLFSRTAMHGATNCTLNDSNVVPAGVVASTLAAKGLLPSGTIQTETTEPTTEWCGHYDRTLFPSWSDIASLRDGYGWSFVAHGRHRSDHLPDMTPAEQWDEVCGSQVDLIQHGNDRADGLFAYPNNAFTPVLQADFAGRCYAFGRRYGNGLTTRSAATTAPYWQSTAQVIGGRCSDTALSCSRLAIGIKYTPPGVFISQLATLTSDQWYTVQSYLLVTGARAGEWNCNGPVTSHWSNDAERYCWVDYLQILNSIPSRVIVTDPRTVADTWARTPPARPTMVPTAAAPGNPPPGNPPPDQTPTAPRSVAGVAPTLAAGYRLTVLPSPAGASWATADAISDTGEVSGGAKVNGSVHAAVWRNGTYADLSAGAGAAYAYDTSSTFAVGYRASGLRSLPIRWSGTTATVLALPGGTTSGHASGINAAGVVVGDAATATAYEAIVWRGDTPYTLAGLGGKNAFAQAVNTAGAIGGAAQTGTGRLHACAWTTTGNPVDLGTLGGADSIVLALNDTGVAVGQADTPNSTTHAVVWRPSPSGYAAGTDLGAITPADDSYALGVNTSGVIVGESAAQAIAWDASGMHRLAPLVNNLPAGWAIVRADAINAAGAIAVTLKPPTGGTVAGILQPGP